MSRLKLLKATSSQILKAGNESLPSTVGTPIPSSIDELHRLLQAFLEQDYQNSLKKAEMKSKKNTEKAQPTEISTTEPASSSTSSSPPTSVSPPVSSISSSLDSKVEEDEQTTSSNLLKQREAKLEKEKQEYELKLMEQEELIMRLLLNLEEKEKLLMEKEDNFSREMKPLFIEVDRYLLRQQLKYEISQREIIEKRQKEQKKLEAEERRKKVVERLRKKQEEELLALKNKKEQEQREMERQLKLDEYNQDNMSNEDHLSLLIELEYREELKNKQHKENEAMRIKLWEEEQKRLEEINKVEQEKRLLELNQKLQKLEELKAAQASALSKDSAAVKLQGEKINKQIRIQNHIKNNPNTSSPFKQTNSTPKKVFFTKKNKKNDSNIDITPSKIPRPQTAGSMAFSPLKELSSDNSEDDMKIPEPFNLTVKKEIFLSDDFVTFFNEINSFFHYFFLELKVDSIVTNISYKKIPLPDLLGKYNKTESNPIHFSIISFNLLMKEIQKDLMNKKRSFYIEKSNQTAAPGGGTSSLDESHLSSLQINISTIEAKISLINRSLFLLDNLPQGEEAESNMNDRLKTPASPFRRSSNFLPIVPSSPSLPLPSTLASSSSANLLATPPPSSFYSPPPKLSTSASADIQPHSPKSSASEPELSSPSIPKFELDPILGETVQIVEEYESKPAEISSPSQPDQAKTESKVEEKTEKVHENEEEKGKEKENEKKEEEESSKSIENDEKTNPTSPPKKEIIRNPSNIPGWINALPANLYSLAHYASFYGYYDLLVTLTTYFDCFVLDKKKRTPLFYACMCGHLDCVRLLLSIAPEWIEVGDDEGNTPLHAATFFGFHEIIDLILSCDAIHPDTANFNGLTAAHIAASSCFKEIQIPSHTIINKSLSLVVTSLQQTKELSNSDVDNNKYLMILDLLYQYGGLFYCIDQFDRMPLWYAIANRNAEITYWLCSAFPTEYFLWLDNEGNTFLHVASAKGGELTMRYLCDSLNNATTISKESTTDQLFSFDQALNFKNANNGFTPSHVAENSQILSILFEYGANLWIKDNKGRMPLFISSFFNKIDNVCFLMDLAIQKYEEELTANSTLPEDTSISTPQASPRSQLSKKIPSLYYLINNGDINGDTPLHIACLSGHSTIAYLLCFINRNIKNAKGLRPSDLGRKANKLEISSFVEDLDEKLQIFYEQNYHPVSVSSKKIKKNSIKNQLNKHIEEAEKLNKLINESQLDTDPSFHLKYGFNLSHHCTVFRAKSFSELSAFLAYYLTRWMKCLDESLQVHYYFDRISGESVWERPGDCDLPFDF